MDGFSHFSDLPLLTIDEAGTPPKSRIKDSKSAHEVYSALCKADEPSSINRARVQAMFDGEPPYDEVALRAAGQAFRCNVNFGEADGFLENAMSAYVDLLNSVEHLVYTYTTFGEEEERHDYSHVISEEITRMIRNWPRFSFEFLNLARHFVADGVGICYFENEKDWRWKSTGLSDIKIPRHTPATEEDIEIACATRVMPVNHLYRMIENPEKAEKVGWNVKECRKAILKAQSNNPSNTSDWEKVQIEIKNNDFYQQGKTAVVNVVHIWVQEFDHSVSHYIILKDGSNTDFLYKRNGRYKSIGEAFVFYTYGLGTNGTYHSIRGLGHKIYPQIQTNNRMLSQLVDAGMLSSSVMLQPQDERAIDNFSFQYMGPFAMLAPGMNFVERNIPNMSNSVIPVINQMNQLMQDRVGQYSTANVFGNNKERTRFEVAAHLEHASKLSVTALNLFYEPQDRLLKEVVRRITRKGYSEREPGGKEVKDFRERCMERGVPEEALYAIDHRRTRAVRAVGAGSQAKRTVSLQQLNELAGAYDEEGRYNLLRDQTASLVGYEAVDRYAPSRPGRRVPIDAKMAQLENADLEEGKQVDVLPNELHSVHLDVHIPQMEMHLQHVEEGVMTIEDATVVMIPVFEHAVQHLEAIQTDPTIQERVGMYRQRLQQLSEIIINGQKKIQKMQRDGEQAPSPEQQEAGDPEIERKIMEHQAKLQMMQEAHELKMYLRLQEAEQKRALKDADKAADLRGMLR